MGLALNPDVKIRPDGHRALLFSVNPTDSLEEGAFRFLYPQQAIMLSLFDGSRELAALERDIAFLFKLDVVEARKELDALLSLSVNREQTIRSFIVDADRLYPKSPRFYDPAKFVVSARNIDMSGVRCTVPASILVLPTMRCVTDCRYCYADRESFSHRREFDLPFFERLVSQVIACGIETMEFSGGDFFCRKDAFDLIRAVLAAGLYPNIPTKYPLDRTQVETLAVMGINTIQVSIDALSPQIIDWMVGRSGYGEKIIATLKYLAEAGIRIRTNTVVTPFNRDDCLALGRYLAENPQVYKSTFTCYGRSLYRHNDDLMCSEQDVLVLEEQLQELRSEFPNKTILFSGPPADPYQSDEGSRDSAFRARAFCTANRRGVIVLPDGRVTVCEELYAHPDFIIGDLNHQTLMEVWNSPKALALAHPSRESVPDGPCRDCPEFDRCHRGLGRCFRDALKAYGVDRPHWPDPRCPRAPQGNRMA